MRKILLSTTHSAIAVSLLAAPASAISLTPIGSFSTGIFDEGAAEISAYDPVTQRLFVTNGFSSQVDVLSLSNPSNPSLLFNIDTGGDLNSVSFNNGILAVAVAADIPQNNGNVLFFNADGTLLNSLPVGAFPDAVTFTPDGSKVLVANEGLPSEDYSSDPLGSVSIIDISGGIGNASVTTAGFSQFNDLNLDSSVRIFGPGASVAQDLEPEFIAVSEDSSQAWVTLQENNALGILDLDAGNFTDVVGLGFKDHSDPENGLDASNEDGEINITTYPNLFGIYQPDAIASYTVEGKTFLVTANEGDARDFDGFSEEARVADLLLDPDAFPNAEELQADSALGRLIVSDTMGDIDGDGDFDQLFTFGGRSFSIFDEDGNLIFDSGRAFETITANLLPLEFNSDNDENDSFDSRSDDKGPEPEGITIGKIGNRIIAFIGLERIGGVISYDITDPENPVFVDYINNRDFQGDVEAGTAGDLGPEGLLFISATDSPNGNPLLVVTNEVSGSTTVYSVEDRVSVPEPSSLFGLLVFSCLSWLGLKRKG